MTFDITIEHLVFASLLSVTVLSHSRKPVFSLQVTSPQSSGVYNVTFGKEDFIRFYRCLVASKTCSVSYTEPYSKVLGNNVLRISGRHPRALQGHQGTSHLNSFCTRTGTGQLKCENKHHADANQRFGVRPLWACHGRLCSCVYFYKTRQISYDGRTAEECSRTSSDITRSKRSRTKRATRSSSRSSSRSRSRPWTSSSGKSSSSSGSVDPTVAKIVGITIGAIVFVAIIGCIIYICIAMHRDKNKIIANAALAESYNNTAEERAADNWKKYPEFPLSDMPCDSDKCTQDGEGGCVDSTAFGDGNKDNTDGNVKDVNESERGNGEDWITHELEHNNKGFKGDCHNYEW